MPSFFATLKEIKVGAMQHSTAPIGARGEYPAWARALARLTAEANTILTPAEFALHAGANYVVDATAKKLTDKLKGVNC